MIIKDCIQIKLLHMDFPSASSSRALICSLSNLFQCRRYCCRHQDACVLDAQDPDRGRPQHRPDDAHPAADCAPLRRVPASEAPAGASRDQRDAEAWVLADSEY